MKPKTDNILAVMSFLTWVAFTALMVKAGAILFSYGISILNPEAAKNVYNGLNLYNLRQFHPRHYASLVSFLVAFEVLKVYISYLVIKLLSKVRLANLINIEIAEMLQMISYIIFATWITAMVYNAYTVWLMKRINGLQENLISGEFILLAGVVYIFSYILKKSEVAQSQKAL